MQEKVDGTWDEVDDLRKEVHRLQTELKDSKSRQADLRRSVSELGDALQKAQVGYWKASQALADKTRTLTLCEGELEKESKKAENLEAQLERIIGSRAWRLVRRYRSLVKWRRRST